MDTNRRVGRGCIILFFLVTVACSGEARKEAALASPPDSAPAASAAFAVLTRPKLSDDDYMAAIAALENANGAADAAADITAGRRLLLATPTSQGSLLFPGVSMAPRDLPEGVRMVRITGFVEGSEKRQIARFQMLARRYATAYNTAMLPAAR